jgi:hypothetical protein
MQSWRRIFYFLILNVIISALTTWAVVTIMLRNQSEIAVEPLPLVVNSGEINPAEMVVTEPGAAAILDEPEEEIIPEVLEIESILGAGELETERVLIKHIGEVEVSLVGWQLQDQDGNTYNFPALTMFQGGAVTVYTRSGTSTVVELYWGQTEPLWSSGERAFLIDPDGQVHAVYDIP